MVLFLNILERPSWTRNIQTTPNVIIVQNQNPFSLSKSIKTGITSPLSVDPKEYLDHTIGFTINYKREDEYDLRELSEIPEIRLWFVRLDAAYPWLPVLLDWRVGELARYAAMLVPHQIPVCRSFSQFLLRECQ
ncbi:unnamed protein product [Camellia sinensis]